MYEPGLTYNSVSRTVDRTFLFKPNHRKDNVLLAEGCPANALDPRNRIIPVPSIINIIGSSVGRALANNPIELNWFEGNVSHPLCSAEHKGCYPQLPVMWSKLIEIE